MFISSIDHGYFSHFHSCSVVNNAGQTAADVAAACGHTQCSAYLQRWQALQNEGSTGVIASLGEEASIIMDIDQSTDHSSIFYILALQRFLFRHNQIFISGIFIFLYSYMNYASVFLARLQNFTLSFLISDTPEATLVNGTYGYQPAFAKPPSMNYRKRGAQGELVLGPMDNEKRCKKLWNKGTWFRIWD